MKHTNEIMKLEALSTLVWRKKIFLSIRNVLEDNKKYEIMKLNKMTFNVKCQLEMSIQFRVGYKETLCL